MLLQSCYALVYNFIFIAYLNSFYIIDYILLENF